MNRESNSVTPRACPALLDPRKGDPVYYLVYEPREGTEVKRRIATWAARLGRGGAGYGGGDVLQVGLMATLGW